MAKELYLLRNEENILTEPVTPITDFTVSLNHMGNNKITATFHYPSIIDFHFDEYVVYENEGDYEDGDPDAFETYYLIHPPVREKTEKSLMMKYDCEFVAKKEILKYVPMIDSFEILGSGIAPIKPSLYQTEYTFFGGVVDYFTNIKSSMIAEFGVEIVNGTPEPKGWIFELDLDNGYPQVGEDMSITVGNTTVFESLRDIHEKFKVPFFVNNNHVIVGGEKKYVSHIFRYGKGNGLYKLTKSRLSDDVITKIRGVGSERNIPYNYLQKEKKDAGLAEAPMSRLMPFIYRETLASAANNPADVSGIQDYYVSDNYNPDFPRISFETFDDIYPTIKGATHDVAGARPDKRIDKITGVYFEASSVADENMTQMKEESEEVVNPRFWIKVPPLGFDLKNHLNEKDKLILSPTTGLCGGCKFNVLSIGSREGKWEGFRNDNYQQYDKFFAPSFMVESIGGSTDKNVFSYETDEYSLPNGTTVNYSFIGEYFAYIIDNDTQAEIGVYVYKNSAYHSTLAQLDYSSFNYGKTRTPISQSGVYTITGDEQDKYKIVFDVQVWSYGSIGNQVRVSMNESNMLITYPVSADVANDTTNESQWLLVQKDLDSYNTLMPYPINPMWTRYVNPESWNPSDVGHVNPNGLVPVIDDEYVFLGITLPEKYILEAEQRLEDALLAILEENKEYKYGYNCGFDEKMLLENPSVNSDVKIGSVILIYDGIDTKKNIEIEDCEEVVINSLTLKYSSDKVIETKTN